jgi:hypothetical protein
MIFSWGEGHQQWAVVASQFHNHEGKTTDAWYCAKLLKWMIGKEEHYCILCLKYDQPMRDSMVCNPMVTWGVSAPFLPYKDFWGIIINQNFPEEYSLLYCKVDKPILQSFSIQLVHWGFYPRDPKVWGYPSVGHGGDANDAGELPHYFSHNG